MRLPDKRGEALFLLFVRGRPSTGGGRRGNARSFGPFVASGFALFSLLLHGVAVFCGNNRPSRNMQ